MWNDRKREEVIVSERLAELRERVRLLTWVSGLSWTVLVLFGGLLVSGVLDWMIHFDDPGLRLVIGMSLLTGASIMAWRQLIRPLIQPLTTTFLALRIERRFPGLHGRVLSAVEFLQHKLDDRIGSPELQQAVVNNALRDLEKIEPGDIVETSSVKRITIAGAVLCAMIATVLIMHPVEAATSVKRLMFPFADCPWPRHHQLKLVRADLSPVVQAPDKPLKIARADTLELYIVDNNGRLPERVWFEYRIGDGMLQREPLRQTSLRNDKGKTFEAAVISWVAARGPLYFRAAGGDDDTMAFQQVDVVQPPTLESLRVTLTPPAYSGRAAETLPLGVGHVQGLLGTRIHVEAVGDKPLQSARLRVADKPDVALSIGPDRRSFTANFSILDSGVTGYWFDLTDDEGFSDTEAPRFEVRGIGDSVPDVVIEQPVADVQLTPDAELLVKVLAKDDLGLRDVRISYLLDDEPVAKLFPLVVATADAEPLLLSTSDYLWKLADLSLQPGQRIVFRAEATDAYDLAPEPHIGRSSLRTITIVSREEKQKELAGRVGDLLEDLQQATTLQQRARQQTSELQLQLKTAGELRTQDLDQLHRIELDQRQTSSRLNRPADGVQSQAQQLQNEFLSNRLDDAEMQQRLNQVIGELSRLSREEFPEIESALTRAAKQADEQAQPGRSEATPEPVPNPDPNRPTNPAGDPTEPVKPDPTKPDSTRPTESLPEKPAPRNTAGLDLSLNDAHDQQSKALEKLQELQDLLSEWRDQRDVSRELNALIADQEKLQTDSAELGQQTLSKTTSDLSPQQKADLAKVAERQMKTADRLDQFRKQLQQAADSLQQRDPDAAERFNDARDELTTDGTAGKLREAAQGIADNQVGTAAQLQQQALSELRDLDKQLKREPTDDTEMLVKQIDEVQQDFESLRKEQADLRDQTSQAASQPDSPEKTQQLETLRQRQQTLGEKLAQAERRLERLRLRQPTEAAERAQERLSRINEQLQDPEQTDEAADEMQQVVDDLEQVERDLALEKRVAEERLAVEELERIEGQLNSLLTQQQAVISETERLEAERAERGSLSRGQLRSLRDLAEVERGLQADAEQMEKSLKVAEVFSLVLRRTAKNLKMAAERLEDKQTGAAVLALERDAVKKIESLLVVLKPDEPGNQPPGDQPPGEGKQPDGQPMKPQEAQPPGESLPQLAQLKLMKALQEEFLERTQLLDGLRNKDGQLPDDAASELAELAREQAELADLTRDLVVKMLQSRPDPEEPEKEGDQQPAKAQPGTAPKSDEKSLDEKKTDKKSDLEPLDLDKLDLDALQEKSPVGKPPASKGE